MGVAMETISSKDIRDHLSDVLNKVAYKGQKYTLTRSGKEVAVILFIEEWRLVEKMMQKLEDEKDIRDVDEARSSYKKDGGIPFDQAMKELAL